MITISNVEPGRLIVDRELIEPPFDLESIRVLKVSIMKYGLLLPPIINGDGVVIDGRKRVLVLREWQPNHVIPCYVMEATQEEIPALAKAFNELYAKGRDLLERKEQ